MAWLGFLLAFCAAASHSSIDLFRKIASKRFTTTQCVCLVAMLEGSLPFAFVLGQARSSLTVHHLSICVAMERFALYKSAHMLHPDQRCYSDMVSQ
jgi:hypothetical protein